MNRPEGVGRTLYQRWRETDPVPEPRRPSPEGAAIAEKAVVQEQFNLALVSMGLTSMAALGVPGLQVLGGASALYGGIPTMARAKEQVVDEGRIGAEVLDTVCLLTTLATRHFVSSSFMFLMYAGGQKLRLLTERAVQDRVIDAFHRRPDLAWVWKDGVEVGVPLESLREGDVVVVDAGSPIPVDGIVRQGSGVVDQQVLTGEAQLLDKTIGDKVFAATLVVSGRLHVEVLTAGKATVAAETAETLRHTADVAPVDETSYEVGQGLTARIGDRAIQVGSRRFLAAHDIAIPAAYDEQERGSHGRGCSLVYVAQDRSLIGALELEPALRPEVEQALAALRKRGVSLIMLSGDHEAPTERLSRALGFDQYFAGVSPGDKAQMIEDLQARGRTVCFVGDGINDAIALKKAAISIAIGGASAAALHNAQIALQGGGLGSLPELFEIADDFERNLKDIMIALGVPSALGVAGVFLAGFGTSAMTTLYGISLASGMTVAMWPHWRRGRAPSQAEPNV